jgi:hypothetical protein
VASGSEFEFTAELWQWDGDAAWHFVSLPEAVADEIADLAEGKERGFGSVRVEVSVGATTWATSVFPDAQRGTYVLPVKNAVRTAEGLTVAAEVPVRLRVLPFDR